MSKDNFHGKAYTQVIKPDDEITRIEKRIMHLRHQFWLERLRINEFTSSLVKLMAKVGISMTEFAQAIVEAMKYPEEGLTAEQIRDSDNSGDSRLIDLDPNYKEVNNG